MSPPSGPDLPHPLTDGQRRRLATALLRLDSALDELEALAASRTDSRSRVDPDLSPEFAREAAQGIARVRAGITTLTNRFALVYPRRSARRRARALLAGALVTLQDSDAGGLRGYGPTDPGLGAALDVDLALIRAELVALAELLDPREA